MCERSVRGPRELGRHEQDVRGGEGLLRRRGARECDQAELSQDVQAVHDAGHWRI